MMKEKGENNKDLQNITQKTKDQVTRTPLKPGGEECADPAPLVAPRMNICLMGIRAV